MGSTGLHRGRATCGRPLAGRWRIGRRHLRVLGSKCRWRRPQRPGVMTRSTGCLAPRELLGFDDGTAPRQFHACSVAVLGGNFADRMAVEVDACRALGHQGPQVGRPGGVALQKDGECLLGEDAWRALMNVDLDAQLDRLDHARTEQRREVLGQQARGVGDAGFEPWRGCASHRGGRLDRLGRRGQRRVGRCARNSVGSVGDVRHRRESGRSPGLCGRASIFGPWPRSHRESALHRSPLPVASGRIRQQLLGGRTVRPDS